MRQLSLIFRNPRDGNYSMERLFGALEPFFAKTFRVERLVAPFSLKSIFSVLGNIRFFRRHGRGIKHVTGDIQYVVPFLQSPVVLTVHDCGKLLGLRGLKRIIYRLLWFTIPCRTADRIVVVSEATRRVLEREVPVAASKIRVVHNCLLHPIKKASDRPRGSVFRILQVGGAPHKNLKNLLLAVKGLDVLIHIVGRISKENAEILAAKGIAFENEKNVPDARMLEIYEEADLLFFASLDEGFGLPILEAQAVGCPVLTSRRASMPEVSGDGAHLVDPENVEEIRSGVERLMDDSVYRARLVAAGYENVERFQPEAVAAEYVKVYEELCECRSI